ncbi:MAG: DUF3488 and DUF4129 domain-containing transglutaminase family protein, partial [Halobacteriaceae archaeon]
MIASIGLALFLAKAISESRAFLLSAILLAMGLTAYLLTVPSGYWQVFSFTRLITDIYLLLTGFSILQMSNAGVWVLGVLPAPTFLIWYFAFREKYISSVTIGAVTLGFFVLTGDSGSIATLLGVLGAGATVGFATLEKHAGNRRQVEIVAATLAIMILATSIVSAVPGGSSAPVVPDERQKIKGGIISGDDQSKIFGSITLSPKVLFVMSSDKESYWRVAVYDRYTGQSWIRTGQNTESQGEFDEPEGPRTRVYQTITVKQPLSILPAAPKPIQVSGVDVAKTSIGLPDLKGTLSEGETFTVVSSVSTATPLQLQQAGQDYPEAIRSTYLEVPADMPDRVGELTANITAGANTAYEKALAIQKWLQANKQYSLEVDRPEDQIVDSFLFEMNKGYCVYFASAMVMMLRTQGIPARYVVGYTSGQRVAEDKWVVRGLDSHAWVEVYFPDIGWVKFDPTPSGAREIIERNRLEEAREKGIKGIDAAGSENGVWEPTETPSTITTTPSQNNSNNGNTTPGGFGEGRILPNPQGTYVPDPADVENGTVSGPNEGGGGGLPSLPQIPWDPQTAAIWGFLVVGLIAGARRSGSIDRLYRMVWIHWQPSKNPTVDIEGAYDRIEYVLSRQYRSRQPGETIREYINRLDPEDDVKTVAHYHELAVHGGNATETMAREARSQATAYIRRQSGILATMFNRLV